MLDGVLYFVFGKNKQLNNCFWKIQVALIRAGWCHLMQADLLIWADSAGWTGWEVLTVLDEWKMALAMVQNGCGVSICWYCSMLGMFPKRLDNAEVLF